MKQDQNFHFQLQIKNNLTRINFNYFYALILS